jgi:hypothetical protein
MTRPPTQLLVYAFAPGADFEGRLVGALERLESGGTLRVADALFVTSDAATGELLAIDLQGRGASAMIGRLLGFRLDPGERQRATERTLAGGSAALVRAFGASLEPGAAVAAVLVQHLWSDVLEDAVGRSGGHALLDEFVDATALGDVEGELVVIARTG